MINTKDLPEGWVVMLSPLYVWMANKGGNK
jgi:hypothetical protein